MAIYYFLESEMSQEQIDESVMFLTNLGYTQHPAHTTSYENKLGIVTLMPRGKRIQLNFDGSLLKRRRQRSILDKFVEIFDVTGYKLDFDSPTLKRRFKSTLGNLENLMS